MDNLKVIALIVLFVWIASNASVVLSIVYVKLVIFMVLIGVTLVLKAFYRLGIIEGTMRSEDRIRDLEMEILKIRRMGKEEV